MNILEDVKNLKARINDEYMKTMDEIKVLEAKSASLCSFSAKLSSVIDREERRQKEDVEQS